MVLGQVPSDIRGRHLRQSVAAPTKWRLETEKKLERKGVGFRIRAAQVCPHLALSASCRGMELD